MRCDEIHERMAEYIGGELGTGELLEFERHLAACEACRAAAGALGAAQRAATSIVPAKLEAARAARGLSAAVPRAGAPAGRRIVRGLALAASLGLAFVLGYLSRPGVPAPPHATAGTGPRVQDTYIQAAQRFPEQSRMAIGLMSAARR